MVNLNRFYTYAYLREDRTPYYIGKGKGNRVYWRSKKDIKPPKDKSRIIFLKKNLTEQEAFKHEIYMIAVFGRKDLGTGILHNRTDGGEGVSGRITSKETKIKLSEAKKGKTLTKEHKAKLSEAKKGKTLTEEHKAKLSEALRGQKNHNFDKPLSEETRRKISEAHKANKTIPPSRKGSILSEEHKRKIGESNKGKILSEETKIKLSEAKKNPSEETRRKISEAKKGKTHSEETKRKMSEAKKGNTNLLGKTHSEESKIKISEAKKGIKWWNDGCGNCKMMLECPGNGWRLGRK